MAKNKRYHPSRHAFCPFGPYWLQLVRRVLHADGLEKERLKISSPSLCKHLDVEASRRRGVGCSRIARNDAKKSSIIRIDVSCSFSRSASSIKMSFQNQLQYRLKLCKSRILFSFMANWTDFTISEMLRSMSCQHV